MTAPVATPKIAQAAPTSTPLSSATQTSNAVANVGQTAGKAAASVGLVTAAIAYWPVTLVAAAGAAATLGAASLKAGRDMKNAAKLIRQPNESLPLTGKGQNLLPFAATAQAAQGPLTAKYALASLAKIPSDVGGILGKVGTAIMGSTSTVALGITGIGSTVLRGGDALKAGSMKYLESGSYLKKFAGVAGLFASDMLKVVGAIPKVFNSFLVGITKGFGSISKYFGNIKLNAGKSLVGKGEESTLLGGAGLTGFFSKMFANTTTKKIGATETASVLGSAATRADRQQTIAASRADLTAIKTAVEKQTAQDAGFQRVNSARQGRVGAGAGGTGGGDQAGGQAPAQGGGGIGLGTIGAGLVAVGAAISTPLIMATKAFATYGDSIEKLSQKTGINADALSGLVHAGKLANVSIEDLGTALRDMQKNIVSASTGSAQAELKFKALGISIKDLQGKTGDRQLAILADTIAGIQDPAIKTAATIGILGESGAKLLPLLNGGSKALERYRKDAEFLGLTMDDTTAGAAARFNDQMARLSGSLQGVYNVIGAKLGPIFSDISNYILAAVVTAREWISLNKDIILYALQIGATIAAAGAAILGLVGAFTAVGVAIAALPFAGVGAAIAGVIGAFILLADTISEVLGFGSLGLADFFLQIQVGGLSIGQWLSLGWAKAFEGFEILKEQVLIGFNYIVAGAKTIARTIAELFGGIGNSIAQGFYSAIKGVIDGITFLMNKVLKAGYELHLIDDQELMDASKAIRDIQEGAKGWADKKKKQANDVYNDPEQTDFFAEAAAKNKAVSEEAKKQLAILKAAQEIIVSEPQKFGGTGFNGAAIAKALDGIMSGFNANLQKAKEGEEGGKRLAFNNVDYNTLNQASAERVLGSFSGAALAGAGVSKTESLQKEGNNLLKQIVENTKKPAVGVLG